MTPAAPSPRSEPLLWLQLLGLGVMPLEALLLLLLLAGSDPGPLPALERLLCWGIGSVAPALLLWRRPADVWSLLLVQVPLRARRPVQQRLSALQGAPWLRLVGLPAGCALSLALLSWIDAHAALASDLSPLADAPRLVALLLAAAVLALLLWQWQQLLQSLLLLSRSPVQVAAAVAMDQDSLRQQRLALGIPLLLLEPLADQVPRTDAVPARREPQGETSHKNSTIEPAQSENPVDEASTSGGGAAVAIEPEEGDAEDQGTTLDQQIG